MFIVGCGAFVGIVWAAILPQWRANNLYLPKSAVVLDKRLATSTRSLAGRTYRPEILITYEVDGRKFEVWAYAAIAVFSANRAEQQAIIDTVHVGSECPCWYDPDQPDKAIVVRGYSWVPFVMLAVPVFFVPFGAVGLSRAWKNWRKPPD